MGEAGRPTEATKRTNKKNQRPISYSGKRVLAIIIAPSLYAPKKIVEGLEMTYQKLVEYKRYKKSPLIIVRNAEVVEIAPEKITPTTIYKNKS